MVEMHAYAEQPQVNLLIFRLPSKFTVVEIHAYVDQPARCSWRTL